MIEILQAGWSLNGHDLLKRSPLPQSMWYNESKYFNSLLNPIDIGLMYWILFCLNEKTVYDITNLIQWQEERRKKIPDDVFTTLQEEKSITPLRRWILC